MSVGISIDGPGELNDVRWAASLERTREQTARTEAAIQRLCREGTPPSLIVTLSRPTRRADKLTGMHAWFRRLESLGVTSVRLHLLEVDSDAVRDTYALDRRGEPGGAAELPCPRTRALDAPFRRVQGHGEDAPRRGRADDMRLDGCDRYTTRAVRGVEGHGQRSNCGRTNKDGIDFVKAETEGFERYIALYSTPQEHGGCGGCRFFLQCKGQCPGTAIDGDWRNRTEHCEVWKGLYRDIEEDARRRRAASLLESRAQGGRDGVPLGVDRGRNTTIAGVLRERREQPATVGASSAAGRSGHGDVARGDLPHGDGGRR